MNDLILCRENDISSIIMHVCLTFLQNFQRKLSNFQDISTEHNGMNRGIKLSGTLKYSWVLVQACNMFPIREVYISLRTIQYFFGIDHICIMKQNIMFFTTMQNKQTLSIHIWT